MKDRIYFTPKWVRIIMWFPLILIPILVYALILNFNVFGLTATILISILFGWLFYFINNFGLELKEDSIVYYGLKKKIFLIKFIQTVEIEDRGYIKIMYEDKKYLIPGFIDYLTHTPNEIKNEELVNKINNKYFYKKKYGENRYLKRDGYKVNSNFIND